jgi:hypothetical protein
MKLSSQNKTCFSGMAIIEAVLGAIVVLPIFLVIFEFSHLILTQAKLNSQLSAYLQSLEINKKINGSFITHIDKTTLYRESMTSARELFESLTHEHQEAGVEVTVRLDGQETNFNLGKIHTAQKLDLIGDYFLLRAEVKGDYKIICELFDGDLCRVNAVRSLFLR